MADFRAFSINMRLFNYTFIFFFFRFSSVIGYYKILSIVPCAICSGSLLVMYFIYNSVYRRIPGTGEPGGLPSMGSHRVGHD